MTTFEPEQAAAPAPAAVVWAAGDYDSLAQRISAVGRHIVERVGARAGHEVLDIACGTGNATIPAAATGARVTGLDITPELLEVGRRHAAEASVEIDWVEGDAERLPFSAESFDVVLSTFGCMFAPDHRRAAAEITRVLRPGGRVGIASWMPDGAIGDFFRTIAAYAPAPPTGFEPPARWGTRDHVKGLFAESAIGLRFERAAVTVTFDSVAEAVEEYETKFGPIVTLRETLERTRRSELTNDLTAMFARHTRPEGSGVSMELEYLVTLGQKSGGA